MTDRNYVSLPPMSTVFEIFFRRAFRSTKAQANAQLSCVDSVTEVRSFSYLPSVIELGNPFSQLLGVFHGRSDTLSDSVVAQPDNPTPASTRITSTQAPAFARRTRAIEY